MLSVQPLEALSTRLQDTLTSREDSTGRLPSFRREMFRPTFAVPSDQYPSIVASTSRTRSLAGTGVAVGVLVGNGIGVLVGTGVALLTGAREGTAVTVLVVTGVAVSVGVGLSSSPDAITSAAGVFEGLAIGVVVAVEVGICAAASAGNLVAVANGVVGGITAVTASFDSCNCVGSGIMPCHIAIDTAASTPMTTTNAGTLFNRRTRRRRLSCRDRDSSPGISLGYMDPCIELPGGSTNSLMSGLPKTSLQLRQRQGRYGRTRRRMRIRELPQ